ncbi:Uu.00g114310.m01.CDS01 [Anthostomella pinea]|uniref:Uu.00g114310.m01.CDS01 n=1 Tax=Anthostomella pinea TaxID=933095 RepID=A0AAI8YGS2_9PEZI|nr:Uu.00g114310.m01.CDS01 [Anthostomella pinea]
MRTTRALIQLAAVTTAVVAALGPGAFRGFGAPHAQDANERVNKRADEHESPPLLLNDLTKQFLVDSSALPEFTFDFGESYAGLLPISSNTSDINRLWFWFVPSTNPAATDEILVFFDGGPGCSSCIGMFYENGPFLWQDGTLAPVQNPWAWTNLTNVMWIDQPVQTGYSTGIPTISTHEELADQFLGFWKNFVDTFGFHGADVYLAGQSYAGRYLSYIGCAMLDRKDTTYYNLQGTMFINALIADHTVQQHIGIVPYVDYWNIFLGLNDTFMDTIRYASRACGSDDYQNTHLVFPGNKTASRDLPSVGTYEYHGVERACGGLTHDIITALTALNPCFDITHISNYCPFLYSPIGVPTFIESLVDESEGLGRRAAAYSGPYLNRDDVKAALHAPPHKVWVECDQTGVSLYGNTITGRQPVREKLPRLIERSRRTIIVHGSLDMKVTVNGTLMALQGMHWGGARGFSSPPNETFYVPAFSERSVGSVAPRGISGRMITERGLTFVEVYGAGHEVPRYSPSGSYRHLEFLLGRVDSMSDDDPFTTDPN